VSWKRESNFQYELRCSYKKFPHSVFFFFQLLVPKMRLVCVFPTQRLRVCEPADAGIRACFSAHDVKRRPPLLRLAEEVFFFEGTSVLSYCLLSCRRTPGGVLIDVTALSGI